MVFQSPSIMSKFVLLFSRSRIGRASIALLAFGIATFFLIAEDAPSPDNYLVDYPDHQRYLSNNSNNLPKVTNSAAKPMEICGRETNTSPPLVRGRPWIKGKKVLLVDGMNRSGRTGNNLREFFHLFQYAKDHDYNVAIAKRSWLTKALTELFYAVQDDEKEWKRNFEYVFGARIIEDESELDGMEVKKIKSTELFYFQSEENLNERIWFELKKTKKLFLSYNQGKGVTTFGMPVGDMCSVIDATLGEEKSSAVYSVIHSRHLEEEGEKLLWWRSKLYGCDPYAALHMKPDYVKSILAPWGMLDHPIYLITDGQDPEVFERLQQDPDIGPQLRLVPPESSWLGGDVTFAIMSNAFVGNPASSLSSFIAHSRLAFGFNNTSLFRKKDENGEWMDVCPGMDCLFGPKMA
mmetsp:Transcript_13380/g.27251  ORF Transcript_13380/g.27251 Transcript_13380/m.27251 type:complete len:407 (-) Transcript_13380:109-1329(-)